VSKVVITMDAGLTVPRLATQILEQGGHYLMVVKRNQHELYEALTWYFATPPLLCDRPWRTSYPCTKGHGRIECRWLTWTDGLGGYLTWPGVQQVLRRETERTIIKTSEVTRAVTYAMTSLRAPDMSAAGLAQLWREHWTIEHKVHYVRDVTLGDDAHQMYTGHAPAALATIRNSLLNLLRADGWTNMAAAFRHYNGSVRDAVQFIRAVPSRP
jgi:predicted transposase YbfD/YdcC